MKSLTRSRAATTAALSLVLSLGMTAGCGGGGDGGGPWDNFVGIWFNEATTTGFTMTCTDANFSQVFPSTNNQFEIFGSLQFEHGELTDLAETSGNCNLLNYNIKGNSATVANPDPYLEAPNDEAGCLVQFAVGDGAGGSLPAFALLTPDASWTVKLLSDKTAGGGDRLQLVGTATADMLIDDGSANGITTGATPCTYGGMDTFFRLTRP